MTTEWKTVCNDINTKLVSKEEYVGGIPVYEGTGIYMLQVPDNFYDRAQFTLSAQLITPYAPNNMRCQIQYYSSISFQGNNNDVAPNLSNQNNTIIIGYERIFASGMSDNSYPSNITRLNNGWKSLITIKFFVPDDINKFHGYLYQNDKYVYPGKDWKLSLTFVFVDVNKILERTNLEKQQKLQLEADKKQKLAVLNEYTYDKLSNYTVVALKKICDNHEISRQGCKADIITRIINYAELVKKL